MYCGCNGCNIIDASFGPPVSETGCTSGMAATFAFIFKTHTFVCRQEFPFQQKSLPLVHKYAEGEHFSVLHPFSALKKTYPTHRAVFPISPNYFASCNI